MSESGIGLEYWLTVDTEGPQSFLRRRNHVRVSIATPGASEYEMLAASVGRRKGSRSGCPAKPGVCAHYVSSSLCAD